MKSNFLLEALYWGPVVKEDVEHRAFGEKIIDFLEIESLRKMPTSRLPYSQQKRVELARALAAEPKLLLLDEPMAGMNVEEKEDMARFILDINDEWGTTIVLIEHDMGVVIAEHFPGWRLRLVQAGSQSRSGRGWDLVRPSTVPPT